jgi:hypothetical protein
MKTKFSFLALGTVLVIATAWTSPGYQFEASASDGRSSIVAESAAGDFSFFRTHRQGKGIAASWGLNSEAGTVGFRVEKTYEDPTDPYAIWENVEYVSCNGSRSYKSSDANVFPGNISYRVVAQKVDGTTVESGISTVHIVSRK